MVAGLWGVIQVCSTPLCMVRCTHLKTTGGTPHLYNRGSSPGEGTHSMKVTTYAPPFGPPFFRSMENLYSFNPYIWAKIITMAGLWKVIYVCSFPFMEKINFWLGAGWVGCYLQRSLSAQVNGGGVGWGWGGGGGGSRRQHWPRKTVNFCGQDLWGFPW